MVRCGQSMLKSGKSEAAAIKGANSVVAKAKWPIGIRPRWRRRSSGIFDFWFSVVSLVALMEFCLIVSWWSQLPWRK